MRRHGRRVVFVDCVDWAARPDRRHNVERADHSGQSGRRNEGSAQAQRDRRLALHSCSEES